MLPAEAEPVDRLASQRTPQEHFGEGHFATEAAGLLRTQADRSRTGRREAPPDRWMA